MSTLTPDRAVEIVLDHAETVPVEPYFARNRDGIAIQPESSSDVELLASGWWQLKPIQTNLFTLHETTTGQAGIVRLSACEAINFMAEIPVQRQYPELSGLSPDAGVSSSGDHFMIKRVPSSSSWNLGLITSTPAPTLAPLPNYPLDRILEYKHDGSQGIDPENQGYLIRWLHPGNPNSYVDYLFSFFFGGVLTQSGYGQFCLTIGGAGRAKLHEWISGAWSLVDEWLYAPPELVTRQMHALRIVPHAGRFIEFRCSITETVSPIGPVTHLRPPGLHGKEIKPAAHVYAATNRGSLPPAAAGLGLPVTGPGQFKFSARRDLRFPFQIVRLSYPTTGYLIDQPFRLPNTPGALHALEVVPNGRVRYHPLTLTAQQALMPQPINATSGANLATQSETYSFNGSSRTISGWAVPGSPYAVKVKITFDNTGGVVHSSPWLQSYEARRRGHFATLAPTPVSITGAHYRQSPATRMELDMGDEDPSHARASIRISDLVNRVSILGARGDIPIRITSTWDPADPSKKVVLWEGYVAKPEGKVRGNLAATYPSPHWTDYRLECVGKWKRLAESDYPHRVYDLAVDDTPGAPLDRGSRPTRKVTDALRHMLLVAGFDEAQIDVPDYPIRFWATDESPKDHLQIQIGQPIGEWIVQTAATYLNHRLMWDANAGSSGMWRIRAAPKYGDASLWTYTLQGPPAGKLAHVSGSYGASTTFVERDTLEQWVVAPEGNFLQITGFLEGENGRRYTVNVRNPKSYNRPGEATADSSDPDYLGRLRPIYARPDPRLTTRQAVKFVARTVFERACRAAIYARFTSPAVFVAPSDSVYTTSTRRPHLPGDVITVDGLPWFVRNCRLEVVKQHHMLQHVEIQRLRAPLSYS